MQALAISKRRWRGIKRQSLEGRTHSAYIVLFLRDMSLRTGMNRIQTLNDRVRESFQSHYDTTGVQDEVRDEWMS